MSRIKYQEAAGLEVKRGRPAIGPSPSKADLTRLYGRQGLSVREVAAQLQCTKDMVHRGLKKYGIQTRAGARRCSALLKYPLSELKAMVKKKGIRGYARELGIDEGTLRYHLKTRKKGMRK